MYQSLIAFAFVVCSLGVIGSPVAEPHVPILAIQPPNHSLGLLVSRQPLQPWIPAPQPVKYLVYYYDILPNNSYVFGFITHNQDEIRYEKGYYSSQSAYGKSIFIQEGFWSIRLPDGKYQTQYYRYPGGIISTVITDKPPQLPRN